ncbi:MAG: disulfide bond formation protein B [Paracoccaceae bacterium]
MTKFQKNVLLAAGGSAGMMLGALMFQYIGGMAPCKMCIWQRWPHGIAIFLGLVVIFHPHRLWTIMGSTVVFIGAGIGFYHAGVEQKWWEGPNSCTGSGLSLSDNLLDLSAPVNIVMCDVIPWAMFGISMAGWNAIISVILGVLWLRAYASSSASQ